MRIVNSFLWILPFISFLLGYQLLRVITHTEVIEVPQVVGVHIHDAIKSLSAFQLNVRILAEKEDADVPSGIIISQSPQAGKKVKPHQSVFLVITRKPPKPRAPDFFGTSKEEALAKAQQAGIHLKVYPLESDQPKDTCIAQSIQPGKEVADKAMAIYISTGSTPFRLFPDMRGKGVEEVTTFFKKNDLKYEIKHEYLEEPGHTCLCTVTEQSPLPGTIIDIQKPPLVRVTVKK